MVSSQEDPDTVCSVCKKEFPSRNKLFQHIKETGHAVHISVSSTEARASRTSDHTRKKGKRRKWSLCYSVVMVYKTLFILPTNSENKEQKTFALYFRQQNPRCLLFTFTCRVNAYAFLPHSWSIAFYILWQIPDAFYTLRKAGHMLIGHFQDKARRESMFKGSKKTCILSMIILGVA